MKRLLDASTGGGVKNSVALYGVSLAAVAAAVVVRLLLDPLLSDKLPFITLFIAIPFAAWCCGRGPALSAMILGAFASSFFIAEPRFSFTINQPEYHVGLVLYFIVGFASIAMFNSLEKARQRLDKDRRRLEQEVVARLTAEKGLADREELLRITFASIGDAVITTDANGNVTFLNAVAQELTGWTQQDANDKPLTTVFNIINEQSRQPVESPVQKALREGKVVGLANHTILISKDGTERPIDDSAAPIRCGKGHVMGVVLVFHDITPRKEAEKALQTIEHNEYERAEEMRAVLHAAPTPIWIAHDPDCHRVTGNPASYQLLGLSEDENVSASPAKPTYRPFQEYQNGVPLKPYELPMQRAIATGEAVRGVELCMVFDDGHSVCIYGNAAPIKNPDGSVRGCVGAFMDITELKKGEEALREADHRKDLFLATLAHELRNPLAPIRNSLELMKLAGGNADLIEQARCTMDRQLSHMVRLIDDLMDVSRITRNRLELRRERVELAPIVHHAVEANRPHCERANHELNVLLPTHPIYLNADPARLAQVFGNLLTNACKYTESGGRIALTAERQGSDVVVTVKDNGMGIPLDMLPKVFDLFTQVDRTLERSDGGLGIGLSLVKRLVEMHDGSVTAQSEGQGQGSEFVVRLPLLIEKPEVMKAVESPNEPAMSIVHRILIVDDNRDAASSLAMLLQMIGSDTQVAHDGVKAVQQAATYKPDVILLDIGLPKMNGYEACRAIREQPWGKQIIIVALTGWGQEADRRKSTEAGFDNHLVKPVDHAILMKLLADSQPSPV